ncbi:MAG: Mur ligase family protein, partial [Verrucomicrobiae bacterium]|nr:Mur ligase family protein [Verrucomicrobiae bacterium]
MTLPATVNSIHFIGIAGTAMAAVAALCRQHGLTVRGSDERIYPPMSTFLREQAIPVCEGYRAENLDPLPDLVCIGNAIRRGNPEVERVLDERLPYCSLPELIRHQLLRDVTSIVVAGTHGKTTTTSLLAWTLEVAGQSPGFLIGGIPLNFGSGARAARGAYFVIEGDEYDTAFFDKRSKFVHYRPDVVVLNNIEFDHADIFPDLAAVKRAFRQLIAIVPRRGCILANGDDANVREVVADAPAPVRFFHRHEAGTLPLSLAGDHNRANAAAVLAAARYLGLDDATIANAFATFRGVKRRMEVRGEAGGVTVLDDFAHHPTA